MNYHRRGNSFEVSRGGFHDYRFGFTTDVTRARPDLTFAALFGHGFDALFFDE